VGEARKPCRRRADRHEGIVGAVTSTPLVPAKAGTQGDIHGASGSGCPLSRA
jgi:hypothetical protein